MNAKPTGTIKFETGKTVYTVEGFTKFMNWMCAAFFNLKGDEEHGVKIDWTVQDHPKIVVKYV